MDWKPLLASITGSVDEELRLRNAYLAAENRILRNQMKARRLLLTDAERKTVAEIGHKLGRQALQEIATIAKPDTILAWHRKFMDQQDVSSPQRQSVGRPRIAKELEDLVVRMARENRSWGYDRIVGALSNLGYGISDQTVGNILKRQGLLPAPERKKTTTWREFIRLHLDILRATDFFTSAVWGWVGLVISSLLVLIPFGHHEEYSSGRLSLLCKQWMLWILQQFLDVNISVQRWLRTVKDMARAQRVRFGEDRRRPPIYEVTSYAYRECLPQGIAKVVRMPAVQPRPIRDGPLRCRQGLSVLRQDKCRAAA
jgi:hypothetical protein